jgi:hypothetical protein
MVPTAALRSHLGIVGAPAQLVQKERTMSVVVTMRFPGDTDKFRRFIEAEPDRLRSIADAARARGCLHHRFGVGDGFVLVVDEWESADAVKAFFDGNDDLEAVIRDAGALGEPEFTFTDAVATVDEF